MAKAPKKELTKQGYEDLVRELSYLKNTKIEEILEVLNEARGNGDLSENADYQRAKADEAETMQRITQIESELINSKIVENDNTNFGKTITFERIDTNVVKSFSLRGAAETNILNNIISIESPLGKVLREAKENDILNVSKPDGSTYQIKIISVSK
ncbi:MAG: GreA/GreB family elongation factor [Acholeplasmatales bacterium]|jgi:transcription elongation factor GreA|nr:GreA/GreB family elongation factor [Acholeplasmatales bacterium]